MGKSDTIGHSYVGIPLRQKSDMQKEEESAMKQLNTPWTREPARTYSFIGWACKILKNNYVRGVHAGWILFCVVLLWNIIFSAINELGVHFWILACFSTLIGVIAAGAYDGEEWVAGVLFPIYAVVCIIFTTVYVFNPSKDFVGIHRDQNQKVIVSFYGEEPWVTQYRPDEWKQGLFFRKTFSVTTKKYTEYDKADILVSLSATFELSRAKAAEVAEKLGRLRGDVHQTDTEAAKESMRVFLLQSIRTTFAESDFKNIIETLDRLLSYMPPKELHAIKLNVLKGALAHHMGESILPINESMLLYSILPSSIKITVHDADAVPVQ